METTKGYIGLYRGYIGIMEKKMETTKGYIGLYRGYIGIMEKKMETTKALWYPKEPESPKSLN